MAAGVSTAGAAGGLPPAPGATTSVSTFSMVSRVWVGGGRWRGSARTGSGAAASAAVGAVIAGGDACVAAGEGPDRRAAGTDV
jgi:hypothetical protein